MKALDGMINVSFHLGKFNYEEKSILMEALDVLMFLKLGALDLCTKCAMTGCSRLLMEAL